MKLGMKLKLKQNIGMSVNIAFVNSAQSGVKQEYWNLHQLCNEIFKQFTAWALKKAKLESTIILKFLKVTFTVLAIGISINKGWYREVHPYKDVLTVTK